MYLCSGKANLEGVSGDCDCPSESNTTCRVTKLYAFVLLTITSQNVPTFLPSEFAKLHYLQSLDLSRNYLEGTIPFIWTTMHLSTLSLMGNRLHGRFPISLTNMTTLTDLSIEGNLFFGILPKEIANLNNLEKLDLSSNNFYGELPVTLSKLTKLTDVRISDNNFGGKIPNFISQWTQIGKLHIQGCMFEGPIPSSISALTQLKDLRISDLIGGASTFPPLDKMEQLNTLVLRNCFIHGPIPSYVGNLRSLHTLDPSFNNLTGNIPSSFLLLDNAHYIYLTENNLTGRIPPWAMINTEILDVSYNNLTYDAFGPKSCDRWPINVVESYSSSTNQQYDIHPCLMKDFPCNKPNEHKVHSLHINCGGEEVNINNTIIYKADTERIGASSYYNDGNWAFSSTGNFLDGDRRSDAYILSNTSDLHNIPTSDTELYTTARTAAISLTYYGLCLANGNYNVTLHFAEIVFTQYKSLDSLGKRVFNVYVQGELKLKNFDIANAAGGTGIAVEKSFKINVKNNTLKIQLYWAGKGTTGIPFRGSYGPIISAISVKPSK
ncbi:putative LRR receptor-like serine/threonine-protein kinase At1g07650 [Bidens hawaiensis]|uniref:putative LRR receptor-like serine/threonine-protein kinase At1g07650 n=1 Tax=Bidens hawaiensis TaxID=980011 RepID=UPI00404B4F35